MGRPTFPEKFSLARYFLFDRLDEGLGSKPALRYGGRAFTYGEVAERAERMVGLLSESGVRRGERLLIALPDTPPFAWALLGAFARGAVVAMANPDSSADSIAALLDYTRATALVTLPRVAEALGERLTTGERFPELLRVWLVPDAPTGGDPEGAAPSNALAGDPKIAELAPELARAPRRPPVSLHRDEPIMWLFTSGSTGEPKANVHTQRDFAFNTEVYAKRTVGYAEPDVTLSVPRLYFGYATGTNLFFPFAVGATVGLFSERPTPETLSTQLASYRPTIVTNVPTMLGKLLDHDEALRARGEPGLDLSSVRFSLSAGEALPEALLVRWLERFQSEVYDGIGSAEMFHIYASNRPGDVRPGTLGKVVSGYELRVLPEEADGPGATPCAPGEIGVLWVKGDSVSQGYWLDRDKSFATFFGQWCKTGDLFRIDRDGYLTFAGRADELLKVSGLWLAPVEVEDCLLQHEAVSAAAVIGVEHEGLTKPKAFVVLRPGFAPSDALAGALSDFVKERLAKHKYPRFVEFVVDLPKNDRGKVDRKALRAAELAKGPT